jgi:hypothetical protein
MKDYALEIKIKNNFLLTMMRQHGLNTAAELARVCGVAQGSIGEMLNLKTPAYTSKGNVASCVRRVCNFFQCTPDAIFPEQHLQETLPVNKAFIEANAEDLIPMYMRLECRDPLDLLIDEEQEELERTALASNISTLTSQQRAVLEFRYGVGGDSDKSFTQTETAKIIGRHKERVRQVETKALRLLRNPGRGLQKLRGDDE